MSGSPLLYLTLCSIRNRLRVRLRRLREPKYLIGSILGVAYFSLIVMGRGGRNGPRGPMRAIVSGRSIVELGATMLMFVAAAAAWIWPRSKPALPFTRAEVQHLFTAPISRRDLVRYRVLRSQVGALAASAIMTFVAGPASVMDAVAVYVGLTILMVTSNMHLTAVALSRASQGARRWVPRVVAAGAVVVVGATLAANWADVSAAAARGEDVAAKVIRLSDSGAAGVVLWPFRAMARLPVARSTGAFLAALPWALLLLTLNYVWVLRTNAPFEEASAELSEKLDQLRQRGPAALRQPRASKRTPFPLAPHGRLETAIVWKNLISMGRILSWTTLIRVAPLVVLLAVALSRGRDANVLAGAGVLVAGFALLLGPQMMRSDLRQDLPALAVLKTWPIRASALVRGEILAPAIVLLTVIVLALIAATALSAQVTLPAAVGNRWSWLLAALLVAPGLVLAQLLTQNALAVIFPSWVSIGSRPGGVDVMGQQMLLMLAVVLALAAAVLPAAIVAAIGVGIVYLLTGVVSVVLAGALAGGALLVEAFIGSEIIGAILERSDISAIDAPES